jgi:molybdopterin converting factor small subunit
MKIKVRYFGMIAEWKGVSEEMRTLDMGCSASNLLESINMDIPELAEINYVIAHNQLMMEGEFTLKEGDEVSLFPPFAGG